MRQRYFQSFVSNDQIARSWIDLLPDSRYKPLGSTAKLDTAFRCATMECINFPAKERDKHVSSLSLATQRFHRQSLIKLSFILPYIGLTTIVSCTLTENDITISAVAIHSFSWTEITNYSRRWFTCGVVKEPDVAVLVGGDSDGEGRVVHHTVYLVVATVFYKDNHTDYNTS